MIGEREITKNYSVSRILEEGRLSETLRVYTVKFVLLCGKAELVLTVLNYSLSREESIDFSTTYTTSVYYSARAMRFLVSVCVYSFPSVHSSVWKKTVEEGGYDPLCYGKDVFKQLEFVLCEVKQM